MHGTVIREHLIQLRFVCTNVPVKSLRRFVDHAKIRVKSCIHNLQGLINYEIDVGPARLPSVRSINGLNVMACSHTALAEA